MGYTYLGSGLELSDIETNFIKHIERLNINQLPEGLNNAERQRLISLLPKNIRFASNVLRHGITLTLDSNKNINIYLLDKSNPKNNVYEVTEELNVQGVSKTRLDVIILINGVPIANMELKRRGAAHGVDEAINQINRYTKAGVYKRGLLTFMQIFIVSNDSFTKYFSISPRSEQQELYTKSFYWTDFNNEQIHDISDFLDSFFSKDRIFKIINDYMIITPAEGTNDGIILRPYQMNASDSASEIMNTTEDNCLIWHATGSGKTLTSYILAKSLASSPKFKKVIMLLDRVDLADQTMKEYQQFDPTMVDKIHRGKSLHEQMVDPKQTFIMTTTQSFDRWIKIHPKTAAKFVKEKLAFVIDECHRTTFGKMFKNIRSIFKKSQFVGFTGTPRFAENADETGLLTKDIFGEAAHIYTIKNAINDGNVLPFSIHDININVKIKIDGEGKNGHYFNSPERIKVVAEHVANNFWKNAGQKQLHKKDFTGYTGMIAAQGKTATYTYWKLLTPMLIRQGRKTAMVFSVEDNDTDTGEGSQHDFYMENLKTHDKFFGTSFLKQWETDRSGAIKGHLVDVITRYKSKEIDMLFVSDMLLTGFDAPELGVIYLDKPLKHHTLLQAMSRVNRTNPKSGKQYGKVVTFSDRNMDQDIDDAITLFSNGTSTEGIVERKKYKEAYNDVTNSIAEFKTKIFKPEALMKIDNIEDALTAIQSFSKMNKMLKLIQTYDEWENKDWAKLEITEDEVDTYSGYFYELRKKFADRGDGEPVQGFEELEFEILSIKEYVIDVAYINQLLHNATYSPKREREKWLEKARKAIGNSDDPEVQKNVKALLNTIEAVRNGEINNTEELFEKLDENRNKLEQERIVKASSDFNIPEELLTKWVAVYNSTGHVPRDKVHAEISKQGLNFLETSKAVKIIISAIQNNFVA